MKRIIEPMLSRGAEYALSSTELAQIFDVDVRTITTQVKLERLDGAHILAKKKPPYGYFKPSKGSKGIMEYQENIDRVSNEAIELQRTGDALKNNLKAFIEQEEKEKAGDLNQSAIS